MAHMHYKGTGKVHSFKGLLADGTQRKIRIQGPVGAIAWRISKFEVIGDSNNRTYEVAIKVWREEQTSIDGLIDFDNDELLAAALYWQSASTAEAAWSKVIFDNALFSRNIYVTNSDTQGNLMNYYIELEEVKLSKAGMAQLAVAAARRTIE